MSPEIQNRNLPLLLAQMRENVISNFRPLLNHYGLTEQQWRVLRVLCEQNQAEPKDLCETCQILSPSMAGILRRLEEMKLIERKKVPGDKRRVMISLSQKSQPLMKEIIPLVKKQYQLLEKAWGKELVTQLYSAIDACMAIKDIPVEQVKLPKKEK